MNNLKENKKPITDGWVSLGETGKGIKWTLWDNNVTFQRREKLGDNWQTTEEFHAPLSLLKEVAWRVSHWLATIDQKMSENR